MSRTRHNLPENINPTGNKCYPLFIPDDVQWNMYILRAIRTLTFDRHWERDDNNGEDAIVVRRRWQESTLQPLINALESGDECSVGGSTVANCYDIETTSDAIQYYPNNPFSGDDYDPILFGGRWSRWEDTDAQNSEVWQYVEDVLSDALGYYANDVFVYPTDLLGRAFSGWSEFIGDITSFWFPYLRFDFSGSGEVDIELLNFPLGGSCFIIPDTDLTFGDLLDTIIDIIDFDGSLPPSWITTDLDRGIPFDNASTQGQNVVFDTDGEHSLILIFVPRIEPTNAPFVFPFGGFRRVEICGGIEFTGSTGSIINKETAGLTINQQKGFIMATQDDICAGFLCALETVAGRVLSASDAENIRNSVTYDPKTGETKIDYGSISQLLPTGITNSQQVSGSAYYQAKRFAEIYSTMNEKITAGFSLGTIQTIVTFGLINYTDQTWLDLVSSYFTANPQYTVDVDVLAEYIFCSGNFYSGVTEYALTLADENKLDSIIEFGGNIPQSTVSKWSEGGQNSPNDYYLDYDCTLRPARVHILDTFTTVYVGNNVMDWGSFGSPRNVRITASGLVTGSTGYTANARDLFDDTGANIGDTFNVLKFNNTPNLALIPPNGVTFDANGNGSWIAEIPAGTVSVFDYRSNNMTSFGTISGEIQLTFEDLGQA